MNTEFVFPSIIGAGIYDSTIYKKTASVTQPRTVAFYELELAICDSDTQAHGTAARPSLHIGEREYPIVPDLAIVTKPGQRRFAELPYRCMFLHLAPTESPICRELDRLPDAVKLADASELRRLFEEATAEPLLHGLVLPPEGAGLRSYARLLSIIALLSSENRAAHVSAATPAAVAEVISYIDTHPGRIPRLDELADAVHMSPIYLHRLFSRVTGKTPYRFILERKLILAKNLLLSTSKPCHELALELGFASASYFTATFRREVGISPGEYRKRGSFEI